MSVSFLSGLSWFTPVIAFLFVFVVVYSILKKTEVLSTNEPIILFVSFAVSAFFILEAQLVQFVEYITGWVGVFVVVIFFFLLLLAFGGLDKEFAILKKKNWFAWVMLVVVLGLLILSASYIFNWVINWDKISGWLQSDWFGFILLLVLTLVISFVITKKAK
jgi:hypothetical protein